MRTATIKIQQSPHDTSFRGGSQNRQQILQYHNLDTFHIYTRYPYRDKEQPAIIKAHVKDLRDKTVVIQNEKGFYLHRDDGYTVGNDPQFAYKYQLHTDNVKRQLKQMKNSA